MRYEDLDKLVEDNVTKRLFILHGNDVYALQKAAERLVASLAPGGGRSEVQVFQKDPAPGEFRQAVNSVPFFCPENIVLLNDCRLFKKTAGSGDADDNDGWEKLVDDVPDFTRVIMLCRDGVDKRRRLFKTAAQLACVIEISQPDARSAREYYERGLRAAGLAIEANAVRLLEEAFENAADISYGMLDNEIAKMLAFKERGAVTAEDLPEIFSASFSLSVFKFCDVLAARRSSAALALLEKLLAAGEQIIMLTSLAARQFRIMAFVKEAAQLGMAAPETARRLKIQPFVVNKAARDCRNYSMAELRAALCALAELDAGLKNGKAGNDSAVAVLCSIMCSRSR